jgi:hypothetical protein
MGLRTRPLAPTIGMEIVGLGLSRPFNGAILAEVQKDGIACNRNFARRLFVQVRHQAGCPPL